VVHLSNKIIKNQHTNYISIWSFYPMFCKKWRKILVAIHILQTAISVVRTVNCMAIEYVFMCASNLILELNVIIFGSGLPNNYQSLASLQKIIQLFRSCSPPALHQLHLRLKWHGMSSKHRLCQSLHARTKSNTTPQYFSYAPTQILSPTSLHPKTPCMGPFHGEITSKEAFAYGVVFTQVVLGWTVAGCKS
jgi:hypothetical protein